MKRVLWVLVLVAGAVGVGYLFGTQGRQTSAVRSLSVDPRVLDLETRVLALEEEIWRSETEVPTAPGPERSAPDEGGPAAKTPPRVVSSEDAARERQEMRVRWEQKVLDASTSSQRLAALRDGKVQVNKHAGPEHVRKFLERILDSVDHASEEGMQAMLELGHLARAEKDYRRSDDYYREVERVAPAGGPRYAESVFQLAWNRYFEGEMGVAQSEFERALTVPDIAPGTAAAARYAVATIRLDSGDVEGGRTSLQQIVASAADHPGHGGVQYYVRLAKQRLAQD